MSGILEMLHEYTAENPNVPILFDDAHSKGITYSQFDEMTGRVYAWLREQGIGKGVESRGSLGARRGHLCA